jgi:hypothetical protein
MSGKAEKGVARISEEVHASKVLNAAFTPK